MVAKKSQRDNKPASVSKTRVEDKAVAPGESVGRDLRLLRSEYDISLQDVKEAAKHKSHTFFAAIEKGSARANSDVIDAYIAACHIAKERDNAKPEAERQIPDDGESLATKRERLVRRLNDKDALVPGQIVSPEFMLTKQPAAAIKEVWVVAARPLELQDDRWLKASANAINNKQRYTYFLSERTRWSKLYKGLSIHVKPKALQELVRGILVPPAAEPLMFRPFGLRIDEDGNATGVEGRPPLRKTAPTSKDYSIEALEVLDAAFVNVAHAYLSKVVDAIDADEAYPLDGDAKYVRLDPPEEP